MTRSRKRRSCEMTTIAEGERLSSSSSHSIAARSRWLVGSSSSRMSGCGRDRAGKGCAARLAAGKLGRLFLAGQAEMVEQIGGAVRIVGRAETRLDIGAHRRKRLEVRHLRQIADGCRWMAEHLAVLRLDQAGRDPQQRRLARAVAADQRDAVAGQHRQRCAVEQRRAAESEADAVELEERWGHGQKSDPAG